MSEQKYYVKLRPEIMYYSLYDGFEINIYTDFWLDKLGIFVPSTDRDKITKSELAKIMDGALYKEMKDFVEYRTDTLIESNTGWSFTDEIIGDIEWINPLIELVPVEDDE